jgi:protein-S-isoprenylcysteine O-methyltransferase Ste14
VVAVGSDLRGRAEEKLLSKTFGDAYRDYLAKTKRFVPGVY